MTIRVMVVDDSVVVRRALADALDAHDDLDVVATAADGQIALRKIAENQPDVVVLDIEMPVMDGLETLVAVRERWPAIAVIMFSTLTEHAADVALEALSLGAVDYATKPTRLTNRQAVREHVAEQITPLVLMWGTRRNRTAPNGSPAGPSRSYRTAGYGAGYASRPVPGPAGAPVRLDARPERQTAGPGGPTELLVVGSSTGGPDALARLLPRLRGELPVPVVIVQHMPPVFTAMLAKRLDGLCGLTVSETIDGEILQPGHAYIAAGGVHLEIHREHSVLRATHSIGPKENSCRPAVDVMFRTAAAATKGRLLAVVLTGMGQDGLLGAQAIVAAGGSVLAQDEATSVVWGMPGFVARAGIADVLPLEDLAEPMSRIRSGPVVAGAPT